MDAPAVAVMAPTLTLSVVVGERADGTPDVHFHPGGQGFWVARLVARLDVGVTLCAPLGGEPGHALRGLVESEGVVLSAVTAEVPNPVQVSLGKEGDRPTVAETEAPTPSRHELDDLYGATLSAGLQAGVAVLTGPVAPAAMPADLYRRLASDLRRNGVTVVADLSGEPLDGALEGGVDLLKLSDEQLVEGGHAAGEGIDDLWAGVEGLRRAGAEAVLLSRADAPSLVLAGERRLEVETPRFEALNPRGAGDTMTAAAAAGLARGLELEEALGMAAAAAALNVTRQGLGTGDSRAIRRVAERVEVRDAPRAG